MIARHWAIFLIIVALLVACLYPVWWVGVICFMVVCQAYPLLGWRMGRKLDIVG